VNNCQDKKQKDYFGTFERVSSIFGQAKGAEHRAKPALAFPFLTYFSGNGDTGFSKKIPAAEYSVAEAVSFSYRQSVAQSLSWLRNDRWSGDASHSESTAKENRRLPWISHSVLSECARVLASLSRLLDTSLPLDSEIIGHVDPIGLERINRCHKPGSRIGSKPGRRTPGY
jgi:hypothetical protein